MAEMWGRLRQVGMFLFILLIAITFWAAGYGTLGLIALAASVAGGLAAANALVDGNRCPKWHWPSEPVIKGDSRVAEISAASILAKVTRDREMEALEEQYPGYELGKHKGYPTPVHLEALRRLGATPEHRRSFRPVQEVIDTVGFYKTPGEAPAEELIFPTDLFEN